MLWRKCGQPQLLHEPEERVHSKWALLSLESWGPISAHRSQPASGLSPHSRQRWLEEEMVMPRVQRVVTVHVSPGSSGRTPCSCLAGAACPSTSLLWSAQERVDQGLLLWGILTEETLNHTSVPFPEDHSLAISVQPRGVHTLGSYPGAHLSPGAAGR